MAEQCNECGQPVSINAEACPHCASPIPTDKAIRKLYDRLLAEERAAVQANAECASMSESEADAHLKQWTMCFDREDHPCSLVDYRDLDKMRELATFTAFTSCMRERFPDNALAAEVQDWGWNLVKARILLSEDDTPYFTDVSLGGEYEISEWDLSEDACEYLGLKTLGVTPSDIWSDEMQHESSEGVHYIYCGESSLDNVERFFGDYQLLVDHDRQAFRVDEGLAKKVLDHVDCLTYNDPDSERGRESLAALKRLIRQGSWDYVGKDAGDTLFILKDDHMFLYKQYRTPWVMHLGDIDEVRIEDERISTVEKLELPYFEHDSSPQSPGYAKSALIGGVLAGPIGAMVGAGYAADRASQGSSRLTTKTFELKSHHTDSEVFFTNRFLPGAEVYLKLEGAPVAFELINSEKLDGFLDALECRIPRARELRTVEFAWVDQHGSAEGLTDRNSGFIDEVAKLDAELAKDLVEQWDRAAAAELKAAEETRAEETRAEERRVAADQSAAEAAEKRRKDPGALGWSTLAAGILMLVALIAAMVQGEQESPLFDSLMTAWLLFAHAAVILGIISLVKRRRRWPTWTGLAIGLLPVVGFYVIGALVLLGRM